MSNNKVNSKKRRVINKIKKQIKNECIENETVECLYTATNEYINENINDFSDVKKVKDDLIKILNDAYIEYLNEVGGKQITRGYFREYLKKKTIYKVKDYEKIWGSFSEFKRELNLNRSSFDIKKDKSNLKNKKYFVTSIIQGSEIDRKFLESIKTYCKINKAELVLLTMRGVNIKDAYGSDVYDELGEYFATEFKFNDNLKAKDFILNPQQIVPTTGLSRFGKKKTSLIIASNKQFLQVIPSDLKSLSHLLYTTGTICSPNFKSNRIGQIAEQDNLTGGLIVEVINKERFNIRNVQSDNKGGFYDLDKYYYNNYSKKIKAKGIVLGDFHFGTEDLLAEKISNEIVTLVNPSSIIMHDVFDGLSVNPHNTSDMVTRLQRPEHQKTLENELNYLGKKLSEWSNNHKNKDIIITSSNHDDFVSRFLTQRKFSDDETNIILGCKLFIALAEDKKNPIEYFLKELNNFNIDNITFLKKEDSYMIEDIECGRHGHLGNSGGRGSIQAHELTYGKSVSGHSHSPCIIRDTYTVGCNCKLDQDYTKGYGTKWLWANCTIYEGGYRQMIIFLDDKWHI